MTMTQLKLHIRSEHHTHSFTLIHAHHDRTLPFLLLKPHLCVKTYKEFNHAFPNSPFLLKRSVVPRRSLHFGVLTCSTSYNLSCYTINTPCGHLKSTVEATEPQKVFVLSRHFLSYTNDLNKTAICTAKTRSLFELWKNIETGIKPLKKCFFKRRVEAFFLMNMSIKNIMVFPTCHREQPWDRRTDQLEEAI